MASIWTAYDTLTTYFTTELNSLASLNAVLGAAIDNSSNRYLYADLELYLDTFNTAVITSVTVHIIASLDDTNYEDGSAGVPPVKLADITFQIVTGNTVKRAIARGLLLPPGKFKLLLTNRTGAAFPAANNTLKYRLYGVENA